MIYLLQVRQAKRHNETHLKIHKTQQITNMKDAVTDVADKTTEVVEVTSTSGQQESPKPEQTTNKEDTVTDVADKTTEVVDNTEEVPTTSEAN